MPAYLRRHHMGLIALFVALGGTSYAATQLPPNSVGTKQIRARAVTTAKIHDEAITSAKLSRALNALLHSPPVRAVGPVGSPGLAGRAGALAYGYYGAPRPCIPTSGIACPDVLVFVGALTRGFNVSLANPPAAGASGFVCLALARGIDASNAVVVSAPDGGANETAVTAIDHAEWIPGAPHCAPGRIEVDTYYVTSGGSGQHATRTGLPFAFAVF